MPLNYCGIPASNGSRRREKMKEKNDFKLPKYPLGGTPNQIRAWMKEYKKLFPTWMK